MLTSCDPAKPALLHGSPLQHNGLLRRVLVRSLLLASGLLSRLAERLQPVPALAAVAAPDVAACEAIDPLAHDAAQVEFHAEPGDSHGALYVGGRLVAWVPGVRRL